MQTQLTDPTPLEELIVASKIRDARRRAGLGQTALAALIEVSQTTISNWELAKSAPTVPEWVRIAGATNDPELLDLRPLAVTLPVTAREPGWVQGELPLGPYQLVA